MIHEAIDKLKDGLGIYCIENTITKVSYIGSSESLRSRLKSHFNDLRANRHASNHFQNSYNKYGERAFTPSILEHCIEEELIKIEQSYFDQLFFAQEYINSKGEDDRFLKLSYNISPTAGRSKGIKKSKEQVEQQRESTKKKWQDPEYRAKQMKTRSGDWGKNRTERIRKEKPEVYIKQGETAKKNKNWINCQRKLLVYDRFTGNFLREFDSIREAERVLGVYPGSIHKNLKGSIRFSGDYIFKYKGDHYQVTIDPVTNFYKDQAVRREFMDKLHSDSCVGVVAVCGNEEIEFKSIRLASKGLKISCGRIQESLKGGGLKDGYTFKYKDPDYKPKKYLKHKLAIPN